MLSRSKCLNGLLALLLAVSAVQFILIPTLARADISEIVIDEDDDMAAIPIPESHLFKGAARHSIPIEVPPGRNGISPKLFLKYNSFGKNGWVGVGWKITENAIRRSTKRGLDYGGSDFVFEGNSGQSELVPRTEWGTGTDYFGSKIESDFTKYHLMGVSQGWEVITRDGTTYSYGTKDNSRQYHPDHTNRVYRWCLDRVEDTNGNYMTFTYYKHQGQIYLEQIEYTGNENANADGNYTVNFELADRTDDSVSYKSRFKVTTAKRLDRIEVYYDDTPDTQLVRKYQLGYEYGTASDRLRLNQLQVFGSDGSSLPATTFQWKEGGTGEFSDNGTDNLGINNFNLADLNGDGYPDAVSRTLTVDQWEGGYSWSTDVTTRMNTGQWTGGSGSKFSGGTTFEIDSGSGVNDYSKLAPIGLGDIDGDGFADLIGVGKTWISKGDGSFESPETTGTPSENIYVGDIDGDGLADIAGDTVIGSNPWQHNINVYCSKGDGTFELTSEIFQDSGSAPTGEDPPPPQIKPLHLADINGDGYADIIKEDGGTLWIYISKGDGTFEDEDDLDLPRSATAVSFGDVNADGLTDLVVRCNYGSALWSSDVYVYLSKGNGGFAESTSVKISDDAISPPRSMSVGDVNGDGRADLVVGNPGSSSGTDTYLAKVDGSFDNALHDSSGSDDAIYMADLNGDGRADLIDYQNHKMKYYLSDGSSPQPDLLSQIETDTGATMTIAYDSSSAHDNPLLPFIVQLVSAITVNDGVSADTTTSFDTYSEGRYDYSDREFRGFGFVKQINADNSIVETYYHQDDFRKGNEQQVVLKDPDEITLTDTQFTWEEIAENEPWGFVKLNSKRIDYYDNPTVFSREDYTYHTENGYLHTVSASGDGAESITTVTEYINKDNSGWVWRLEEEILKNSNDVIERQTKYTYDDTTGNLETKKQVLDLLAETGPSTSYGYDTYGYGNVTSITDPRGNPTGIEYDSITNSHPDKVIYPQTGCGTPAGCVDHVVEYLYDYLYGKVSDKKDENGNWTEYDYDPFARLKKVKYPDGGEKNIDYFDTASPGSPRYVLTKIKENATDTIDTYTYYDGLNRKIETITHGDDNRTILTLWHYDNMGRQDRVDGPFFGSQTSYLDRASLPANKPYRKTTFDYRSRPETIEQPLGNSVEGGGPALTQFDYSGFAVTVTDPDGSMKKTRSDYLDRIREVVEYTDSDELHTYYEYNAAGDLLNVTDALGNEIDINYDSLGRKTDMTDPDMGWWRYSYDANGNLTIQIDAENQTITFDYDELNRVTSKSYSTSDPTVTYTYDEPSVLNGTGRLYRVENTYAETIIEDYDEMGRKISVTRNITGAPVNPYTTDYTYDLSGKLSSMVYPDTNDYQVNYTYHPKSGLLETVTGITDLIEYAEFTDYEPTGKIGNIYHDNGTQTTYSYDAESTRLMSILTSDPLMTDIQEKAYEYTAAGDIDQITDTKGAQSITYNYGYDKLHRLISENSTGASDNFNFSILSKTFDNTAPLHAVKSVRLAGVDFTYAYDANGNMTTGWDFKDPTQVAERSIIFNADNMPEHIERTYGSSTTTVDLFYDGEGKRVKKAVQGGGTTYYIGDHFEVANGIETKYIFGGNLRIAKVTSTNKYFYHKDHLGSSTVMTNHPAGLEIEAAEYLPFGLTRKQTGTEVTYYKFTDQEYDAATGLYNYNARLYDPAVGTFISPDSIVPNVYDPQSLNRFAYARNNPLKYNDPDGHAFVLAIPLGIAAFEYAASTTLGVTVGIVVGAWLSDVLFNEEQENKPYSDRRPYTRKPTLKDAWDKADDGEQEDTKSCPDCGKDVKGNPHEGEPRKGEDGWDLDHIEKWGDIRDGLDTQNVPPSDYRDAYNDTNNTRLRCPSCNRSDNRLSNNNEASGVGSEGEIDSSVDLGYW